MNKTFFIAWAALFVAWMIGSMVVHGMLLGADYAQLPNLFRPEAEASQFFPLMIAAHVVLAGAFVWIYSRGAEAGGWAGQGLRFGVAVALLTVVPTYTIYYVVQPMPGMHVVKQIAFDGILIVLLGLLVAWLYRHAPRRG